MSETPGCPACRCSAPREMSKLRLAALIALAAAPGAGAVIFGQQRGVAGKVTMGKPSVGKPSSSIKVAKSEESVLDVPRTEETVRTRTPPLHSAPASAAAGRPVVALSALQHSVSFCCDAAPVLWPTARLASRVRAGGTGFGRSVRCSLPPAHSSPSAASSSLAHTRAWLR